MVIKFSFLLFIFFQVFTLSVIFLILSLGNIITTYLTVRHKIRERVKNVDSLLRFKYLDWKNLPTIAQRDKTK